MLFVIVVMVYPCAAYINPSLAAAHASLLAALSFTLSKRYRNVRFLRVGKRDLFNFGGNAEHLTHFYALPRSFFPHFHV